VPIKRKLPLQKRLVKANRETLVPVRVDVQAIAAGLRLALKLPNEQLSDVVKIEAIGTFGQRSDVQELVVWYRPKLGGSR
jgi:hypothetical protein